MVRIAPLMALALGALAGPAALAQSADADVRCLMASNVFATAEKDPGKQRLAVATGLFFTGRADARLSPEQLKAAIVTQGKTMTTATVSDVMTVCARTFQAKERALQALGRSVAQAQAGAAKPVATPAAKK